jgi:hypothetical protein
MFSIYKIEHKTNPDLVYVGSTSDFNRRKRQHKRRCNSSELKVYQMIREHGGWNEFDMVELNQIECTKLESRQEEDRVRIQLNARLNMIRAVADPEYHKQYQEKYYEQNREQLLEKQKQYQEQNQEQILEYKKQYREQNQEQLLEKQKRYREQNQEQLLEKQKQYYEQNREQIKEQMNQKFTCECGGKYTYGNKSQHFKSRKHIASQVV